MKRTKNKFIKNFTQVVVVLAVLTVPIEAHHEIIFSSDVVASTIKIKREVKIGYLPLTHAYPLFAEEALFGSTLTGVDLNLVKFGSWPDLVEALNSGRIDGASILLPLALKAKENGVDLKAVALGHRDGNVFVVQPDIKSITQLKGKTVAIPSRLSSHALLLADALKKGGLTEKDVKIIELAPPEMPAALAEKRIAGYLVAEPFGAKSVAIGKGRVLTTSDKIWKNSLCCGLVLRGELIQKNRAAAKELVRGYVLAAEKLEAHDHAAENAGKTFITADDKVLTLSRQWISYKNLSISKPEYEQLSQRVTAQGIIKRVPTYIEFVDNSLITELKK